MKIRIIPLAVFLISVFGLVIGSQSDARSELSPTTSAQDTALPVPTYILGPSDEIAVTVVNFPELTMGQITVPPDGKVRLPLIGSVMATGETPDQLAEILTKRWSEYVIDPSVTVALVQKRSQTILVYGYIVHSASVEYKTGLTILQAIAMCGGVAFDGDASQVSIAHASGTKQVVDLSNPETKAGTDQDLIMQPDDLIYVPQRHMQISVLGQVIKGGSFDYADKMTVLDAISQAGGVDLAKADLTSATLIHNGVESKLDLEGLLKQGKLDANVPLSPGDRIFVPLIHDRTYVFGAVGKPGYYDYAPGDRILDALNDVGGPTQNADLSRVNVVHIDKAMNTATTKTVNIKDILTGKSVGDLAANIQLVPGDILYVPDKRHQLSLSDAINALGSFSVVGNAVKLFGL